MIPLSLLIFFAFIIAIAVQKLWRQKCLTALLPPGPKPVPFIGNIFQYDEIDVRKTISKWHREYGPVYTVWKGMEPTVYITNYSLVCDLFQKHHEFEERPDDMWVWIFFAGGKYGIVPTSGEQMKEQKWYTMNTIHKLGFGEKVTDKTVINETDKLIKSIKVAAQDDKVLNMSSYIELCVVNIISSILYGRVYDEDEGSTREVKTILDVLRTNYELLVSKRIRLLKCYPFLRFVPILNRFGYDQLRKQKRYLSDTFRREIERCKRNLDDTIEPKDFTSVYLQEIRDHCEASNTKNYFSEKQLANIVYDFWTGGIPSLISVLNWLILLMIKHPDVQKKVHQELDNFFGDQTEASIVDRNLLPYTNAVIQETLRYTNVIPGNFSRKVLRDTTVNGYKIPAGISIKPQMCVILHDEVLFDEPLQFNPDRFINTDGKLMKKCDGYIPFLIGKRSCPGESLSITMFTVIFTFLMKNFHFSSVPGEPQSSSEPVVKFIVYPPEYRCLITVREQS